MSTRFLFLIVLLSQAIILGQVSPATAVHNHRVLFIAAYHPAFPTFQEQVQGLRTTFDGQPIELDIEFMDAKRFDTDTNLQQFYERLAYKLSQQAPYEALIVADDSALTFALTHQNDLFAEIPIVFFGVNNVALALAQNDNAQVTGVIEAVSVAETIDLMVRLQPNLRTVYAVVDGTDSGQGDLVSFYNTAVDFPTLTFGDLSLTQLSFTSLGQTLASLPPDSAVLLLSAYQDSAGNNLSFEESLALITQNTAVPVYHLWYHGMGDGLVGGKLISHNEQAKHAAQIVLKLFDGQTPSTLPVYEESPNLYVVDYDVAQQWQLSLSNLPPETVLLNKPLTIYEQYRSLVLASTAVFTLLLMLITALMYALWRLRQSEHKYRTYISSAPYGIIVSDANGHIQELNPTVTTITGYGSEEVQSLNLLTLTDPREIGEIEEASHTAVSTNMHQSFFQEVFRNGNGDTERRVRHADRNAIDLYIRAVRLNTDQLLIYFSDETQRKQAERALQTNHQQLQETLEQLQEAQTRLIHQERLAAVGQLTGGIAHDFNNILASILLYSEMAQKLVQEPRVSRFLQTIIQQSHHAADLVQQMLDFGRQAMLAPENIELAPFIGNVVRLLRRTLPETIEVAFEVDGQAHYIYADPLRVQQAVINLALNARDAMPDGGYLTIKLFNTPPETTLACVSCDPAPVGHWVGIAVQDTGSGISDD
ncbi:MAG: PAS domain S-box protein, partial [Anaerolineales bacterium]|nr:PAS domain S-box protein [Anaerolineales bacterium]